MTATWYGDAFASWTTQCLRYATQLHSGNAILLPFRFQPLRVLKQITTMILAVSGATESSTALDALRSFVLIPHRMAFPREVVIACYLNPLDPVRAKHPALTQNRLTESCAVLDTRVGASLFVIGEVAFPPMGYVAYVQNPGEPISPDFTSLCNLDSFSRFYLGQHADRYLRMPVRYPYGPVPGHYPDLRDPKERTFLDDNHVLLLGGSERF